MAKTADDTFRCQIMSDLHLETHQNYDYRFEKTAPHLALLGDIGHIIKPDLYSFLERQIERYDKVFFILGNHEPYHLSMEVAKELLRRFARQHKNFHFLDQMRVDVGSVTILGCTLFSRVTAEQARAVQSRMVDFRDISNWDVGDHVDAHLEDLQWLNDQVQEVTVSEPGRPIIIFTHHCPSTDLRASNPLYHNRPSEVSSGFATDLSDQICWKAASMWAWGHTHYNCDFTVDGVRAVANQKGYMLNPQKTFNARKVFEIRGSALAREEVRDVKKE